MSLLGGLGWMAALLPLGGGVPDFDYGRLAVLWPASDHVVFARVVKVGKDRVTLHSSRVLKGPLAPGPLVVSTDDAGRFDACMGGLEWKVGEECCFFLQRGDPLPAVVYGGSGKQSFPMRGVLTKDTLIDLLVRGRLEGADVADLVSRFGPRALDELEAQCQGFDRVTLDFEAAPIQDALVTWLRGFDGWEDGDIWAPLTAFRFIAAKRLRSLPESVVARVRRAAGRMDRIWHHVGFLGPLARAGFPWARDRLLRVVTGDFPKATESVPAVQAAQYRFAGWDALVAAGLPRGTERAWAAFAELTEPRARLAALEALLRVDRLRAEREIVRGARQHWRQSEGWVRLLARGQSPASVTFVASLFARGKPGGFRVTRFTDDPPLPLAVKDPAARRQLATAIRSRLKAEGRHGPDELRIWLSLYMMVSSDRSAAHADLQYWFDSPITDPWRRTRLLRTAERYLGTRVLEWSSPTPDELRKASQVLATKLR